jgi:hypothetical protein
MLRSRAFSSYMYLGKGPRLKLGNNKKKYGF